MTVCRGSCRGVVQRASIIGRSAACCHASGTIRPVDSHPLPDCALSALQCWPCGHNTMMLVRCRATPAVDTQLRCSSPRRERTDGEAVDKLRAASVCTLRVLDSRVPCVPAGGSCVHVGACATATLIWADAECLMLNRPVQNHRGTHQCFEAASLNTCK